jgi:hypothetical protein
MKLSLLRKIIREEIINTWRHNIATRDNNPYSYEDYPEVSISTYKDATSGGFIVSIECEFDQTLSEPDRTFPTELDADAYGRKKAEIIHRAYLATQK